MAISNLLGVILAFVTVMLLLSLVVMALVQFAQAVLRLRSRNLLVGVSWLLDWPGAEAAAANPSPLRRDAKLRLAAEILNEATDVHRRLAPGRDPNATVNIVRGPKVAWVEPDNLADVVVRKMGVTPSPAASEFVKERFKNIEPAMSDRFASVAQQWTIAWAIFVAIAFQVSTPALFHSLSVSDARREAIIAMVPDVVRQAESFIPESMADDFVDRALARLEQDFGEHADRFAQVSGSADSKEEMLEELRAVLAGVPGRDAIVARYAAIIDELSIRDINRSVEAARGAVDSLDVAGISFWRDGAGFYFPPEGIHFQNVIGVLITAILLSFGAPFWFEQVKNVAKLRSALSKDKK